MLLALLWPVASYSQGYYEQYFDGADTTSQSVQISFGTDSNNVWQIGPPQKTLFNAAATEPNVLVTDTINPYITGDTSMVVATAPLEGIGWILAVEWMQKLDLDTNLAGAVLEYSLDDGQT